MNNGINVGNPVTKDSQENLSKLIETIFRTGAETRMEQKTIRAAIRLIPQVFEVKNVSISNSNFRGDNHIHLDDETVNRPQS